MFNRIANVALAHNDTAKRIVWRIPPNCVLGACYAYGVSFLNFFLKQYKQFKNHQNGKLN